MVVHKFDIYSGVLELDPLYAKILAEHLFVSLGKPAAKKAASRLAAHGLNIPDEQIITGLQTIHAVLSKFTDTYRGAGAMKEEAGSNDSDSHTIH